ncbi:MAG: type III secretion system chaperone [Acidobacteriota bacterium]|nr:type III secretion system chaperone [Blastocatellia bacterium]MDW8411120.1 type III secretion system chaperone [Acidobacteriota bacterium]
MRQKTTIDASTRAAFLELFELFRSSIGLHELQLDESDSSYTVRLGNDEVQTADITIEPTAEGEVLLYSSLDRLPNGLTPEIVLLIDTVNANKENMFFLSASEHHLFLCSSAPITEVTATRLVEWVKWFYEQVLEWRNYRKLLPEAQTQPPPISTGKLTV